MLIVTTSYPERDEGAAAAGSFVADFALEAARQSIEVAVVAPAAESSEMREGEVWVHRFAVPHLPLSTLQVTRPLHWRHIARTLQAGQATVNRVCAQRGPDHILALWALPSGAWAQRAGARYEIPYSTWALGSDIWTLGRIPGVRQVLSRVLRAAQVRFADGYQLAEDVTRISGRPCAFLPSTRLLPPRERTRPLAERPPYRLGFLGRWHPNKGVDLLLDALTLLEDSDWALIESLQIAGGGPLEAEVLRRAGALQTAGRPVRLSGYLDRMEATAFLQSLDYLIIPSRIESIPVLFSDAMQAGTPVIASPVGDLPELLRQQTCGIALAGVDPPSLLQGIRQALATKPGRYRVGMAQAGARFDLNQAVQSLKEALNWI
nr:glycosyltransferase [Thiorhodococcus minor]